MSTRIWNEHEVPEGLESCQLCELAKQRRRVIWGEGNPHAAILALLDNPGAREDANGVPFVCGTRITLQEAAAEVGLGEADLYVTYVLKCRPIRAYDKQVCRDACMSHLQKQLEDVRPRLAICFGNIAVQSFFGDEEAEVKRLRGAWHEVRGIPTIVTYHPLAVRRRPSLRNVYMEDWRELARRFRSGE
ncbi:uracil-DNA glycosylase [Paenibacillus chartarius]|uniref:Uracil-DNA glycosylase n=1 Tax=Paenibacillus chartarius TaxID=747481 RepID=A0ABV6DQN4_9BACL